MKEEFPLKKILLFQAVGFLTLMLVAWTAEVTGLRALIAGEDPPLANYREAACATLVILVVGLLVAFSTRRILNHVRQMQGLMRVCAWCRHIHYKGEWIQLEHFMQEGFDTPTTHGICPECLRKQKAELARSRRKRLRPRANHAPAPHVPADGEHALLSSSRLPPFQFELFGGASAAAGASSPLDSSPLTA